MLLIIRISALRNSFKISLFLSLFLLSCGSVKNKPEVESNFGHNFTSKYNILFHAKQLIQEVEENNKAQVQLDYDDLLPVELRPNLDVLAQNTHLMDSSITKSLRVINEKNKGKYVNEAYYLIAKANYLKGNFYNAAEYGEYLRTQYADFPKYKQSGLLLEAQSLLALDRDTEAADVLDLLFVGLENDKKTQAFAFATQAEYYIKEKDWNSAALMLEQALEKKASRADKNRWKYLLGQIYLELDKPASAYPYFTEVSKRNPNFNMSFRANLERIRLESVMGEDINSSIASLKMLLRDDKNKEFLDQIHYIIAEQYLTLGDSETALAHLEKSLETSTGNGVQKAKTYMLLGDFYFDNEQYGEALTHYNQAATTIPLHLNSTQDLQKRLLNYQQITENLVEIQNLSLHAHLYELEGETLDSEIRKLAEAEYEKKKSEFDQNKKSERNRLSSSPTSSNFAFEGFESQNVSVDSRFYFNNPEAIGIGENAFRTKWGNRPLVDNWRYASAISTTLNPENQGAIENENASSEKSSSELESFDDFYLGFKESTLSKIPANETDYQNSLNQIKKFYESNGEIYRFNLDNFEQATAHFISLIEEYPEDPAIPRWAYQIYQMNEGSEVGEKYKNLLLNQYQETVFANIIRDPNYFRNAESNRQYLLDAFQNVHDLFESRDYGQVRLAVEDLIKNQPPASKEENQSIFAQLAYLRALAIGYEDNIYAFQDALVNIEEQYKEDEIVLPLVKQQILYINENFDEFSLRESALVYIENDLEQASRRSQVALLPWPELVMRSVKVPSSTPIPRNNLEIQTNNASIRSNQNLNQNTSQVRAQTLTQERIVLPVEEIVEVTRDLEIFPDNGRYYFVINVMHPTVNLSPSRLGIGQFNRSRYAQASISHQVKIVNRENQLVFVGPFNSYNEVRNYEFQIQDLLKDIMKIPAEYYNSFIATDSILNGFKDAEEIYQYQDMYSRQK